MKSQLDYWGVDDYTRVSAYDGREDDLSEIIYGQYPIISSGEVGCNTSHLEAQSNIGWRHLIVPMLCSWKTTVILRPLSMLPLIGILLYPKTPIRLGLCSVVCDQS